MHMYMYAYIYVYVYNLPLPVHCIAPMQFAVQSPGPNWHTSRPKGLSRQPCPPHQRAKWYVSIRQFNTNGCKMNVLNWMNRGD